MVRWGSMVDGRRSRACFVSWFWYGLHATMAVGERGPHLCELTNPPRPTAAT